MSRIGEVKLNIPSKRLEEIKKDLEEIEFNERVKYRLLLTQQDKNYIEINSLEDMKTN